MAQHECKISVCCCLPPFELFLFRDMTIAGALVTAHIMLRCAVDSQLCLQFTFAKFINDVKYVVCTSGDMPICADADFIALNDAF